MLLREYPEGKAIQGQLENAGMEKHCRHLRAARDRAYEAGDRQDAAAANGPCPKTGQPRVACSDQCFADCAEPASKAAAAVKAEAGPPPSTVRPRS
eukprot:SAG22_NODE_7326_length_751_cov_1.315951_1_plen_96_part_00